MTSRPRRKASSISTTTVIPFPGIPTGTLAETSRSVIGELVPAWDTLSDKLKTAVETIVAEAYIKQALQLSLADDPFDAVYISRLTADDISQEDVDQLKRFAHIVDESSAIAFNDGWDD